MAKATNVAASNKPATTVKAGSAVKAGTLTTRQVRVLTALHKAGKAGLWRNGKHQQAVGLVQITGWPKGWSALMGAPSKAVQGPKTMQALGLTNSTVVGGHVHCTITKAGSAALVAHNKANNLKAVK